MSDEAQPPPRFDEPGLSGGVDSGRSGWGESTTSGVTGSQPFDRSATVTGGPRSGFWRRFAAAFIDGLIIGAIAGILELALKSTGYFLGVLVWLAYFTYFEGGPQGAAPGKRVMGIRVIDFDGGGSIGHGRAFIRTIGKWVSAIVFYLGYLWMLWDGEKQCWHDKFANDVVVPTESYPVT